MLFLRIEWGVSSGLFLLVLNPLYLISPQATESQLEWGQVKLYTAWSKKGSSKKIKTSIKKNRFLQIALEMEVEDFHLNGNFAWENFNHSMPFPCWSWHVRT